MKNEKFQKIYGCTNFLLNANRNPCLNCQHAFPVCYIPVKFPFLLSLNYNITRSFFFFKEITQEHSLKGSQCDWEKTAARGLLSGCGGKSTGSGLRFSSADPVTGQVHEDQTPISKATNSPPFSLGPPDSLNWPLHCQTSHHRAGGNPLVSQNEPVTGTCYWGQHAACHTSGTRGVVLASSPDPQVPL